MQQLCLEVSSQGFTYSVVHRNSKEITDTDSLQFSGRTSEECKTEIKELLDKKGLLSFSDDVSLAVVNHRTTLVPQNVFGESKPNEIFNLCFGSTTEDIDYNRFYEQGLVNIYEIQDWIKSFFVIRYPRVTIQHENTHVMRGIFSGNAHLPAIHIVIQNEYFSLLITSKNKLDFYNVFEYKNVDDIVYHTMFVWEQKEIDATELTVQLHSSDDFKDIHKEIETSIVKLKPSVKFNFKFNHKIKHQLLCV